MAKKSDKKASTKFSKPSSTSYDHRAIEKKWADVWFKHKLYQAPSKVNPAKKLYILPQLPYPSGSGLHVGHAEVYSACDIYARYQRMNGKQVLQVIGWDAFGLPAENYAVKTNVHPKITTNKAIKNFRYQLQRMGVSLDWGREVGSHNPDYYKWTQWFFLLMFKRGLAYRKKQAVNWCDGCQTTLANEQVVDGHCERCDTQVIQKDMEQWFLKITDYADRLSQDLDQVDWPEETIRGQRYWIGRKDGAEIDFRIKNQELRIKVFTTRPDTLFGATFMVLAPEHQMLKDLKSQIRNLKQVQAYINQAQTKTELERKEGEKEKTGIILQGISVINPVNQLEIPIFVADYVLMDYGEGAVMGVPAHDQRDFEFAQKFQLPIKPVIKTPPGYSTEKWHDYYTASGKIINSGEWNNWRYPEDLKKVLDWLEERGIGKRKTAYRLRDWLISRQRFWGAPIPIVYDPEGKPHPVDQKDLPVLLPDDVDFQPTGQSPLTYSKEFQKGVEQKYGKGWRREVDTMDTFMCSSWYYYRYVDPKNDKEFASQKALKIWMPVDFYLGGPEHIYGHLLYSRFFTKVLRDAGYVDFDEPFLVHRHQGLILGEDHRKMSKRWNNVINPTDVMDRHGADTLRLYEMFMGPLSETKAWNTRGEAGIYRFIVRVWNQYQQLLSSGSDKQTSPRLKIKLHQTIKKVGDDIPSLKFNTAIAAMMEFVNLWSEEGEWLSPEDSRLFLLILAPFAPFITEELWQTLNHLGGGTPLSNTNMGSSSQVELVNHQTFVSIHQQSWPKYAKQLTIEEQVEIPVQVNGKLRATLTIKNSESRIQKSVESLAKTNDKISKWLEGKKIVKTVFIPGKLLNFVVS